MRLYLALAFVVRMISLSSGKRLFDFTARGATLDGWMESSDTVREVGMSKAELTLQKTQVFQRAVLFTLLNPQPNGAAFAGSRVLVNWDLSQYDELHLRCRAQGQNTHYKIVLRHEGKSANDDISYEQFFEVPISSKAFAEVVLPLDNFKPYFRGQEKKDAQPLNRARVTMFGFQIYGGVYSPIKQSGVSALEIETVDARKHNELPADK